MEVCRDNYCNFGCGFGRVNSFIKEKHSLIQDFLLYRLYY